MHLVAVVKHFTLSATMLQFILIEGSEIYLKDLDPLTKSKIVGRSWFFKNLKHISARVTLLVMGEKSLSISCNFHLPGCSSDAMRTSSIFGQAGLEGPEPRQLVL